jgi:hypothetical protein
MFLPSPYPFVPLLPQLGDKLDIPSEKKYPNCDSNQQNTKQHASSHSQERKKKTTNALPKAVSAKRDIGVSLLRSLLETK